MNRIKLIVNNVCTKCDVSCNTCINSATECLSCNSGKVFFNR